VSRADLVRVIAMHWLCPVCGEVTHSETQPERCPPLRVGRNLCLHRVGAARVIGCIYRDGTRVDAA
jgi:ABC-type ATPase with predicted acetyltransferase domain